MSVTRLKPVDAVVVGVGVAGSIVCQELAAAGPSDVDLALHVRIDVDRAALQRLHPGREVDIAEPQRRDPVGIEARAKDQLLVLGLLVAVGREIDAHIGHVRLPGSWPARTMRP